MKNKKNKILMALILSSLFITGCDKEKMQAKKEEKIKNAFIQEISVLDSELLDLSYTTTTHIYGGYYQKRNHYLYKGLIYLDLDSDGIFTGKDKKIELNTFDATEEDIFSFAKKGSKMIYIKKDFGKVGYLMAIVNNDSSYVLTKPSRVYPFYKNTKRIQELDKIFEEKYLKQR